MARVEIGPSILTADFLNLGDEIAAVEAAGVDFIHLDVMDGQFVPNISFGLPVVAAIRRCTALPLDVHLMIDEPERFVPQFVEAGADYLTIHVEACRHLHATLRAIGEAGAIPGVTLNPLTPLDQVEEAIPFVGQVLIMSVNPGFGGQTFIPSSLDRIRRMRELIDERRPGCRLEVDGGVRASNIARVIAAGADRVVVGSAFFNAEQSVAAAVHGLRQSLETLHE